MSNTSEPVRPGSPQQTQGRPGPMHRFLTGLIKVAAGFALLAAILFFAALMIVPGKRDSTSPIPSTHSTTPVTDKSFTDVEICSGCHWDMFTQWSGSMHSQANDDSLYVGLYELANADTGGKAEEYCGASACHAPVGFLAGEDPFPHDGLSPIAKRAVFCDFCHTVSGRRGIGDASYVVSPGPVKRGPYTNAQSPYHQTTYSKMHTKSQFCGMCHNVSNPITGLKLETTYDEWARSRFSKPGKGKRECQDCHMRPYAGRAAPQAPRRPNIFSHYFGGANAMIPAAKGQQDRVKAAKARLRSAARMSFARATRSGDRGQVAVKVTNIGAGHWLPTGITEIRQMWVRVIVKDQGKTIYTSGMLSPEGVLDPQARLFHTVLGDKNGQPVTKVWRATQVLSDKRIPPGKSSVETYRFNVPRGTGPLTVEATLMYRSASQDLADLVVGENRLKVPAVEMTRAKTTL